jgi:hypothetical protein
MMVAIHSDCGLAHHPRVVVWAVPSHHAIWVPHTHAHPIHPRTEAIPCAHLPDRMPVSVGMRVMVTYPSLPCPSCMGFPVLPSSMDSPAMSALKSRRISGTSQPARYCCKLKRLTPIVDIGDQYPPYISPGLVSDCQILLVVRLDTRGLLVRY